MQELIERNIEVLKEKVKKIRETDLIGIIYNTESGEIVKSPPGGKDYSLLLVVVEYGKIYVLPYYNEKAKPFRLIDDEILKDTFTTDGDFNVLWSIDAYNSLDLPF